MRCSLCGKKAGFFVKQGSLLNVICTDCGYNLKKKQHVQSNVNIRKMGIKNNVERKVKNGSAS